MGETDPPPRTGAAGAAAPQGRTARLELRLGEDVHVVLEGDPAFVMDAYQRVKDDVTNAVLAAAARGASAQGGAQAQPAPVDDGAEAVGLAAGGDPPAGGPVVWVYRCGEDMRTVYAAERTIFAATRFARAFRLGGVGRVYVEDDRVLRALRHGARTLWRELDPAALQRIKEAGEKADAIRAASQTLPAATKVGDDER